MTISSDRPDGSGEHLQTQDWAAYTAVEHDVWRRLYRRQARVLPGRVAPQFLAGLERLAIMEGGIPDFRRLNDVLGRETGWRIVPVKGLIPDAMFFELLASRRFPSTCFIRTPAQIDYLQEPDVFHDVFGHVPLLVDPVFADYMQAYGKGGLRALNRGVLRNLARLYWYTVEFGLMETAEGLRIYGAGIVSSRTETLFAEGDPSPNRVRFDLTRVLRTEYRIDDLQETYFVIRGFDELFALAETDFGPIYDMLDTLADIAPGRIMPEDAVLTRGTGAYHTAKRVA